uniref:RanBD1 domain-containing protein n=1 Tax=Parascaris univalens TaxID=6257 RepID=A0A915CGC7_PARUN
MAAKKPFVFKSSKLSTAADQLWTASKSEFKPSTTATAVKLDLGKTLIDDNVANAKLNADLANKKGFIFGSKLTERVIVDAKVVEKREEDNDQKKGQNGDGDGAPKTVSAVFEEIQKKGTTSSFLAADRNQYDEEGASTSSKLKESADEAELQRRESINALSKSAEEVDISTGEENEVNVCHVMCKLHSFELTSKSWHDRGMGSLRINRCDESTSPQYRIVGRITGNQRVMLNSRIFADMVLEKVSTRRLKFSATTPDSELPVLFLATASEFVTEQLYSTLAAIIEKKKEEDGSRKRKASDASSEQDDDGVQPKKTQI